MALIQWDSSFSVNVEEIDRQHQRLIQMVNDLNDAMRQGRGKDVLARIIEGLTAYTLTHFATEEKYFDQFGYADTAAHKKAHSDFVSKVSDVKQRHARGELGLTIEIMDFLSDWLNRHIKGSDKAYGPFFNEKGLK